MEDDLKLYRFAGSLKMKFKAIIVGICLLHLANPSVCARGENEQPPEVSMRIDVVAWGNAIPGLSLGEPATSENQIQAHAFRYGQPVRYQGPQLLAIYQSVERSANPSTRAQSPEEESNLAKPLLPDDVNRQEPTGHRIPDLLAQRRIEEPTLVALVNLPLDSNRLTLLLVRGPAGTFRAYVIEDDPSKLPIGQLRVYNLSSHEIAMQFHDDETIQLASLESTLVQPLDKFITYRLAYLHEDSWRIQENNVLPIRADQQTQMIILKSDHPYFLSGDGGRSGFMQVVVLRRRN